LVDPLAGVQVGSADSAASDLDPHLSPPGVGLRPLDKVELSVLAGNRPHRRLSSQDSRMTRVAVNATLHCLTGCAIGEITGLAIGTAAGLSDFATIALAVALAFLSGYTLTSLPLLSAAAIFGIVVLIAEAAAG
jgi:hypothetical protein